MRILVDVRHLTKPQPSGVGEYTIELLRALFDLDQENDYLLFSTGRTKALTHRIAAQTRLIPQKNTQKVEYEQLRERVEHAHMYLPNKYLKAQHLLFKKPLITDLIDRDIDLIFLPNLNYTLLPDNIPTVLTIHDLSFKIFPECYSTKMQLWHKLLKPEHLIKKAKAIITPSTCTKQDVHRFYDKAKNDIHVVPHGLKEQFTHKQKPQDHGVRSKYRLPKRFALFMATIEPRKNVETIIDAMKAYRKDTGDDLHLVLAGNFGWRSNTIKKQLEEEHLPWIKTIGYVDDHDRPSLYRNATTLLWPSLYEGFGLPVIESMASGTPVITSHTSSLPEVTGNNAILIDPYNPRDLTEALKELMQDKELYTTLQSKGLNHTKTFSWQKTAKQTLQVFNKSTK